MYICMPLLHISKGIFNIYELMLYENKLKDEIIKVSIIFDIEKSSFNFKVLFD